MSCPLTHKVFVDPVIASDGFTYEKKALEQYMKYTKISPMTGQILYEEDIFPNYIIKSYKNDKKYKNLRDS